MGKEQKKIDEIFRGYPVALKVYTEMTKPNEEILIYKGNFVIKNEKKSHNIKGKVVFRWLPTLGVIINGTFIGSYPEIEDVYYDMYIDDSYFCKLITSTLSLGSESKFIGQSSSKPVLGDRTISVSEINFIIPNMEIVHGSFIRFEDTLRAWTGKLEFENDKYLIEINSLEDFKEKFNLLKNEGGYISLVNGSLKCKKGSLSSDQSDNVFYCFSKFISFIYGHRISPILRKGLHDKNVIWTDCNNYTNDIYKNVTSLLPIQGIYYSEIWNSFYNLWAEEDSKDFLISVIHWYVEANANSGYLEGSIILIQTALELIYNWYVIEQNKLIFGKDSEDICAANKIRLLMSQVGINQDLSIMLPLLNKLSKATQNANDEIDIFVQIRNAIVHSQKEKREKLKDFSSIEKSEAKQFGLWLIELSILKILNYNGKYHNRCSSLDEFVPFCH